MSSLHQRLKAAAGLEELARHHLNREDGFSRDDLSRMLALARSLNECREPSDALLALLKAAIRLTGAERAVLVERDGEGHRVTMGIDRDGEALDRPEERVSHSILDRVLRSGQALKSENLSEEVDLAQARSVVDLDLKSSLCVPLRRSGEIIGAIYVDSNSTSRFREPMLALLEGTCELASMTLAELHMKREEARRGEVLKRLEATHATVIDALPSGLLVFDGEGRVQLGNATWERELRGVEFFTACKEAPAGAILAPVLLARIRQALELGEAKLDVSHKRGELRLWPFELPALDGSEALFGAILADVSLEKRMQHELLEKEKMGLATQMAGSIAHEIRNALAPLCGHAEVLQFKLGAVEAAKGCWEADLSRIDEMARRIQRIAENLAQLSKPLSNRPQSTDINGLVLQTVELLRETGGKIKGFHVIEGDQIEDAGHFCTLKLELEDALPQPVVDPDLLQQLLMNLVINAAHAVEAKGSGRITLRTERVGDLLRLAVEDTGTGMPPEVLARIWEPYFSTKGERGTGLGMSLVRMVAEAHKAPIHAESRTGEGTTFHLDLPLP